VNPKYCCFFILNKGDATIQHYGENKSTNLAENRIGVDFIMKMNDSVFGELEHDYVWTKDTTIQFFENENKISLMIDGDEDGIFDEEQYLAYQALMKNWNDLQQNFLQKLLEYYQQRRYELGYDIAFNENYPLVETTGQILEMIELDGIVVPYGDIREGRDIGVLFNCSWDKENGVGLRLLDEEVIEVGYQDIVI
jgi:hypothetical protein